MSNQKAVKQRGFWFKGYGMKTPLKRDPVWMIEINDNPADPDWAAWCAITDMGDIDLDDRDMNRMACGGVIRISGLVV